MSTNKIGFNNFKAFGEKMQTFSKKPITLVYGPNSIGKSSFLHSQLYLEYLRNDGTERDLDKTNFAGDELNLGGFNNFIHKNNLNNTIQYELTYRDYDDINKLFDSNFREIKELKELGLFVSNITLKQIENRFEDYQKPNNLKLEDTLNIVIKNRKLKTIYGFQEVLSADALNEAIDLLKTELIMNKRALFYLYCKKNNMELKDYSDKDNIVIFSSDFEEIYKSSIEKIENSDDILVKAFILTDKSKPKDILDRLELFRYISEINEIKLNIELKKKDGSIQSCLKYYIDNELIFNSKEVSENKSTINSNKDAEIYRILNKYLDKNSHSCVNNQKISSIDSVEMHENGEQTGQLMGHFLPTSLANIILKVNKDIFLSKSSNGAIDILMRNTIAFLNNVDNSVKNQYFGPLRFYPQRWDLSEKNKEKKDLSSDNEENILQLKDNIMYKKPLLYVNINFWAHMIKSGAFNDAINPILPNNMKLSSHGAYSSEKMWSRLIQSKEIQEKLNKWFSDESKLKTPYEIVGYEYNIQYNKVYKFFRKIFGFKQETEKSIKFVDRRTDVAVTPRDMGLGISQVLPILVSCLSSEKTNIFIEQPELHLHPAVQGELADEFIRSYKERDNEFMIETHSEHLLLRIMKRMRYTAEDKKGRDKSLDLTPDDVCLLYVDCDGENTFVNELELDKDGTLLDIWPNGFFEEGYNERFD